MLTIAQEDANGILKL